MGQAEPGEPPMNDVDKMLFAILFASTERNFAEMKNPELVAAALTGAVENYNRQMIAAIPRVVGEWFAREVAN
jgi:branched-subunit amino acid transport protein